MWLDLMDKAEEDIVDQNVAAGLMEVMKDAEVVF